MDDDLGLERKRCFTVQALLKISGLEDLLAGIGPYSQRHIAHLDRLECSSFVIDYSLSRLNYISESSDT